MFDAIAVDVVANLGRQSCCRLAHRLVVLELARVVFAEVADARTRSRGGALSASRSTAAFKWPLFVFASCLFSHSTAAMIFFSVTGLTVDGGSGGGSHSARRGFSTG
eukprot:3408636-Prymnesium_polylepis.1